MLGWQQAPHHQALLGKSCSQDEEGWGGISICPRAGMRPGEGFTTAQLPLPAACWGGAAFDPDQGGKLGVKAQPRVSVRVPQAQEAPETRREARSKTSQLRGRATHGQVQHVHRHRLLCQHLHRGVRVDRDGAAAHCQAQRCQGGLPGGSARGTALARRPRGAPSSLCQNKTSKPNL